MHSKLIQRIQDLVEPLILRMGLELWGIELLTSPRGNILRIFVDCAQGVSLDHCQKLGKQLGLIFDVEDPLPGGAYTLEVSSPGLERPFFQISQLPPYLGKKIAIKLKQPVRQSKKWRGTLSRVEGQTLMLETSTETITFNWEQISKIHLLFEDPVPAQKPKKMK